MPGIPVASCDPNNGRRSSFCQKGAAVLRNGSLLDSNFSASVSASGYTASLVFAPDRPAISRMYHWTIDAGPPSCAAYGWPTPPKL